MSTTSTRLLTAEEYLALPDDGTPNELVRGEIVELSRPNYRHGRICSRIDRELGTFVERRHLGEVVCNDSGVITERGPDTVRGPDVAFYATDRLLPEDEEDGYPRSAPDVIFEVLSPSNRPARVREKLAEYFAVGVGVGAVCVIDGANVTATLHHAGRPPQTFAADQPLTFRELPGWTPTPAQLCRRSAER